jgi:hypothetical protein
VAWSGSRRRRATEQDKNHVQGRQETTIHECLS